MGLAGGWMSAEARAAASSPPRCAAAPSLAVRCPRAAGTSSACRRLSTLHPSHPTRHCAATALPSCMRPRTRRSSGWRACCLRAGRCRWAAGAVAVGWCRATKQDCRHASVLPCCACAQTCASSRATPTFSPDRCLWPLPPCAGACLLLHTWWSSWARRWVDGWVGRGGVET